jgi:hypothetical protein
VKLFGRKEPRGLRGALEALGSSTLGALARSLGLEEGLRRGSLPAAVAGALGEPARIRRLVESLPKESRSVLFLLAAAGGHLRLEQCWGLARTRLGLGKSRCDAVLGELRRRGLLEPEDGTFGLGSVSVAPGLAEALLPLVLQEFASADPGGVSVEGAAPFPMALALVAARAARDPVRLTYAKEVFLRWTERAGEELAGAGISAALVERLARFLADVGALRESGTSQSTFLRLEAEKAVEILSAPAEDLALSFLSWRGSPEAGAFTVLALLERVTAKAPAREAFGIADLLATAREATGVEPPRLDLASSLGFLSRLGLVVRRDGPEGLAFARAKKETAPPGRWIVQPNFEVLVPADAPPAEILRLATFADLSRAGRVCVFALTKASVTRAALSPPGSPRPLDVLARNAEHDVPENVAATVSGWLRRGAPMRAYEGVVVVSGDEEQAAFLRSRPGCLGEIVSGVFHFTAFGARRALEEAAKRGHPVASFVEELEVPDSPPRRVLDVRGSAEAARKELARVASAAPETLRSGMRGRARQSRRSESDEAIRERLLDRWPCLTARLEAAGLPVEIADRFPEAELCRLEQLATKFGRSGAKDFDGLLEKLLSEFGCGQPGCPACSRRAEVSEEGEEEGEEGEEDVEEEGDEEEPDDVWIAPPPGRLREEIEGAVASRAEIQILYVNSRGEERTHRIRPERIHTADGFQWLGAYCFSSGAERDFRFDRIAAVKPKG